MRGSSSALLAYRMIKRLARDDRFIDGDDDYNYYNGPEF